MINIKLKVALVNIFLGSFYNLKYQYMMLLKKKEDLQFQFMIGFQKE